MIIELTNDAKSATKLDHENGITSGCTMRITYMNRDEICTIIDVDFLNEKIWIQNKTDDLIHRAFGILEHPKWEDFEIFLRERCFPETRGNKDSLLKSLGLDHYDPLSIVEKTQGRMCEDYQWMKFEYISKENVING